MALFGCEAACRLGRLPDGAPVSVARVFNVSG